MKAEGIAAFVGQLVTVQFKGRLAIFKTNKKGTLDPVQEKDEAGNLVFALSDCLDQVTLLSFADGFLFFSMKAPDNSVADFTVHQDLIGAIWRPTRPPSSILA